MNELGNFTADGVVSSLSVVRAEVRLGHSRPSQRGPKSRFVCCCPKTDMLADPRQYLPRRLSQWDCSLMHNPTHHWPWSPACAIACGPYKKTGRFHARLGYMWRLLSLVADTPRSEDHATTWRLSALTDHATFTSVAVVMPVSVMVTIIPIGADADANRTNLHAHSLSARWC